MKTKHLFLLIATLLALVACNSNEPTNNSNNNTTQENKSIVGTWSWTGEEKGDKFTITLIFNNDNTAIIKEQDLEDNQTATASYTYDSNTNKLQMIITGGDSDWFLDDKGLTTFEITWFGENQILIAYSEDEQMGPFIRQ